MPKIQYVGVKKDGETAFVRETGITWFPGTVKTIADAELVAKMLRHPDVFALADGKESDGAPKTDEVFGTEPEVVHHQTAEAPKEPVVETKTDATDADISLAPGSVVAAPPPAAAKDSAKAKAPVAKKKPAAKTKAKK
ncbi:hypothetical protein [Ramlibacter sp.]|uniref:hypothetical protein n=1 Tax=Ramlibacter sp. TaxID=1917967 RepID=UPI003D131998